MKEIILLKYGEIILKGLNRPAFENVLMRNIRAALHGFEGCEVRKAQAAVYIMPACEADIDDMMDRLSKVFGVLSITRAREVEKNLDAICKAAVEYCGMDVSAGRKFKVEAKRADKAFPQKSPEICYEVGGYIFENVDGAEVDVNNPNVVVRVEVRDFAAYVYTTGSISSKKLQGQGGLPIGTGGKASLLLSGGIDSPVAGYMIAKRGVEIDAINFFSYPYTSDRAKEKVIDLAKLIAQYTTKVRLHIVPFTEIQLKIRELCPEEHMTLVMRRFMMMISERIAKKNGSAALITGESLGQVASQTMQALHVTNSAVDMPVFRPLIGMDKEEIITISRRIGTFETSILPYEDCCTVFTPKHPTTKPKLDNILKSEARLEVEALIEKAIEGVEVMTVLP